MFARTFLDNILLNITWWLERLQRIDTLSSGVVARIIIVNFLFFPPHTLYSRRVVNDIIKS